MVRYASLAESVGNTPLIGLPNLSPSSTVRLWAKLEDKVIGALAMFRLLDHLQRGPVLDRAGRVAVLQLGPQPHVR